MKIKCQQCGEKTKIIENMLVCQSCNYELDIIDRMEYLEQKAICQYLNKTDFNYSDWLEKNEADELIALKNYE